MVGRRTDDYFECVCDHGPFDKWQPVEVSFEQSWNLFFLAYKAGISQGTAEVREAIANHPDLPLTCSLTVEDLKTSLGFDDDKCHLVFLKYYSISFYILRV